LLISNPPLWVSRKTIKKNKIHKVNKGTQQYTLRKILKESLDSGNVKEAVKLPQGQSTNEWVALNTIELFNTVVLVYSLVEAKCNSQTCPTMIARGVTYFWADEKTKKPTSFCAHDYINHLNDWISEKFTDETLFPMEEVSKFPKNFIKEVKNMLKRIFRVYAHIYHSHMPEIKDQDALAHLNTCYMHFYYFVKEFDLITDKNMEPLEPVVLQLINNK